MIPIEQKAPPGDRAAAEWNDVAKATRRRRRILQSRILFHETGFILHDMQRGVFRSCSRKIKVWISVRNQHTQSTPKGDVCKNVTEKRRFYALAGRRRKTYNEKERIGMSNRTSSKSKRRKCGGYMICPSCLELR